MRSLSFATGVALLALSAATGIHAQVAPPDVSSPMPENPPAADTRTDMPDVTDKPLATDVPSAPSTVAPTTNSPGMTSATTGMTTPSTDPARMEQADQAIAQGWSRFDTGGKGQLTPLEFGKWMMSRQGQDMNAQVDRSRTGRQANLPATRVLNATAIDFSRADTNRDRMVSQDELRIYLAG